MNVPFTSIRIPDGPSLILYPMDSVQSVAINISVAAGSRYETHETSGTAHFLEHMLFEGTEHFPSAKKIASYIESIGGKNGAWTDKEYVSYYVKVPKKYLETAFRYFNEVLFHSLLDPEAIEKEKGIITEEIKRKRDNPEVEIWDLWSAFVWGKDQPLGKSILGDEASIKEVSQKKLLNYITKFYYPQNMAIAIVGNFSLEEAKQYASRYFTGHRKQKSTIEKANLLMKRNHIKIIKANTQQIQLLAGFVTDISYTHKDRFILRLIADILSGGVNARLFQKLIYQLGIAYSAFAQQEILSDIGLFFIYCGFSPQNTQMATKAILQELNVLSERKISQKELEVTLIRSKASSIFSLETPDTIANWYAWQQITEGRILSIEEYLKKLDEITAEDIQRVAQKYFTNDNFYVCMRGPISEDNIKDAQNLALFY